jgi:hypothetical protein
LEKKLDWEGRVTKREWKIGQALQKPVASAPKDSGPKGFGLRIADATAD